MSLAIQPSRRRLLTAGLAGGLVGTPSLAQPTARLNLNENPWGPSPAVARAVRAALSRVNRYVEDESAALIAQIAALERVSPDQIILGEVLAPLGLQLALEAGASSRFVYSTPGYAGFTDAAQAVGGKIVGAPLNAEGENDLSALLAATGSGASALFFVNPHNPSGTVSDPAKLRDFLRAASRKTLVIVDEAYLEFSDDFAGRSAVALVREGGNVVVFRTLAKAYGLAGLQAGYALLPSDLAARLRAKGVGAPHTLDQLALAASAAALGDQTHVAWVRRQNARERDLWHAALDRLGWPRTRSQANFVFFKPPKGAAALRRALAANGIVIGRPNPPLHDWARISIGLPAENARARAAVARLG